MSVKVYLSPSNQTSNTYAYGNTTEAIQCGRVAAFCKTALERNGVAVMLGQYDTMANRCAASNKFGAQLHVPIHSNACNKTVGGTRMFCSKFNGEGYKACKAIFDRLAPITPGTSENIKEYPGLYEVAHPKAPTAYIEMDFHDVPVIAKWIIENAELLGETIAHGICDYFKIPFVEPNELDAAAPVQPANPVSATCAIELPVLKQGMKNGYVKTLQIILNAKGNYKLVVDGDFGAKSNAAVTNYKAKNGLASDGIVDKATWESLHE